MKNTAICSCALVLGLLSWYAFAAEKAPMDVNGQSLNSVDASQASLLKQAQRQRAIDMAMAPIKSQFELALYMQNTPQAESPLSQLSPVARQHFLASLVFSDSGLGSFDYSYLRDELTPTQIYKVLSLFGVQSSTPLIEGGAIETSSDMEIMDVPASVPGIDYHNHKCNGVHSCYQTNYVICTSNC